MNTGTPVPVLVVGAAPATSELLVEADAAAVTAVTAHAADEALAIAATTAVAAIVFDCRATGFDWMALGTQIRSRSAAMPVPILFAGIAAGLNIAEDDAYALRAVELLPAPLRPAALRSRLDYYATLFLRQRADAPSPAAQPAETAERPEMDPALAHLFSESERRHRLYETFLSNTPDLAYVFDLDHRFIYANEVLLKMWGKTWAEAIGKTCLELGYEPWHAAMHDREIELVKATMRPIRGEVPFNGTFGRRIYDYIFVPVIGPDGAVEAVAGTTRDVTERKQTEDEVAALLNQEKRRAALLSKVAEASSKIGANLSVDCIMRILVDEARAIIGVHQATASLSADNCTKVMHTVSLSDKYAEFRGYDAQADGSGIYSEVCRSNRPLRFTQQELENHPAWKGFGPHAGDHPPLRGWLAVPLVGHGGNNLGLIQVSDKDEGEFTDEDEAVLTHLAAIAAVGLENARLYDSLREQDKRKDEFLATLAHELRNPLAPLRTGLDLLTIQMREEPAARIGAMMERQLTHLVRLVDDLMDVSRLSRGKLELKQERLPLRRILEAALETSRPLIEAGRHSLALSAPEFPLYVDGDLTRLAQCLGNLLNNAAKYTPSGGTIRLSAQQAGTQVAISVADNGIGISGEMLPRVFELFTQVNDGVALSQGGLGIGLSLVQKLIEMHGGTVTVASDGPGHGAIFKILLPIAAGGSSGAPVDADSRRVLEKTGDARRILVVDDNTDAADTLAMLLELTGHVVRVVHSGGAALEVAEAFRPDAIFLDIGLPGMSGYQVASALRRQPGFAQVLLVALTGWGSEDDRRQSQEAGFDMHLTKPVDLDMLSSVLKRLLPAA